jgi:hypothetical protein
MYPGKRQEWIFVVDQLNIHISETLVQIVATECDCDKGKQGAFLNEPPHRVRFVYVPKHSSWLNQIEIWFSILVRRLLKRASFTSTADLQARVLAFIDYFNRTLAKPFKWTYTGRPLRA